MKKITSSFILFLSCFYAMASTINVSTSTSSGVYVTPPNVDPNWVVSGPSLISAPTYAVSSYLGFWEPTPISGTNAGWINPSTVIGSETPGNYTFERSFTINPCTAKFACNFNITCDDSIISLQLIPPVGSPIALSTTSVPPAYYLDNLITNIISSPVSGTWKIRAVVDYIDAVGGFMLSGYINDTPGPCPIIKDDCCANNIIKNGNIENGSVTGDLGSGGTTLNWKKAYYTPQISNGGGCNLMESGIYHMSMWGVGVAPYGIGEGVYQNLNIVAGKTYQLSFCARFDKGVLNDPGNVIARFRLSNSLQTSMICTSCTEIGDVTLNNTTWETYTMAPFTATSSYNKITINAQNLVPASDDGSFASWLFIDNICLEEVTAVTAKESVILSSNNYKVCASAGTATLDFECSGTGPFEIHYTDGLGNAYTTTAAAAGIHSITVTPPANSRYDIRYVKDLTTGRYPLVAGNVTIVNDPSCRVGGTEEEESENPPSIDEMELANIAKIYPNPTSSSINIDLQEDITADIEIFNLQGDLMDKLNGANGTFTLGEELPEGAYLIHIETSEGKMYNYKIIKAN
ncbi:MAG: T9SS type A sorting domain-containing protein [Fimbriimonadaceae bacterium]|nr:T9SS type A sorting domain-containing protein [Chitinophagales bacterium]